MTTNLRRRPPGVALALAARLAPVLRARVLVIGELPPDEDRLAGHLGPPGVRAG